MSANTVIAAVAVGVFLVLCAVGWYVVLALKQVRRTALAMEQFLLTTRPRVEVATEKLSLLIGRADRFLASIEEETAGAAGSMSMIGRALAGWSAGAHIVSTISSTVATIVQAWTAFSRSKKVAETGQT